MDEGRERKIARDPEQEECREKEPDHSGRSAARQPGRQFPPAAMKFGEAEAGSDDQGQDKHEVILCRAGEVAMEE